MPPEELYRFGSWIGVPDCRMNASPDTFLVMQTSYSQPSLLFGQVSRFHAVLRAQFLHGRGKMIAHGPL